MNGTLRTKEMNTASFHAPPSLPPSLFFVVVEGEWVGCIGGDGVKAGGHSQTKDTHLQPEIPYQPLPTPPLPKQPTKTSATVLPPQRPTDTLPGLTAPTSAHARSHTISHCGSQSLSTTGFFFLFCLFSLSSGVLFFYC